MFNEIHNHEHLFAALRGTCYENGVGINFSNDLKNPDGEINDDLVIILKVDYLYSTAFMHNPPKSIDCLIIVKCKHDDWYDIHLVELRNVGKPRNAHPREISEKFLTVINDMFTIRFPEFFEKLRPKIRKLKCYLVTDPFKCAKQGLSSEQAQRLYIGTALDAYGALPPLVFGGHAVPIEVILPDPIISGC